MATSFRTRRLLDAGMGLTGSEMAAAVVAAFEELGRRIDAYNALTEEQKLELDLAINRRHVRRWSRGKIGRTVDVRRGRTLPTGECVDLTGVTLEAIDVVIHRGQLRYEVMTSDATGAVYVSRLMSNRELFVRR